MAKIVTAAQLAQEVQTSPGRLGRWLRAERVRGHTLLADSAPGARWEFSREDADRLGAEFKVGIAAGRLSDSAVQRRAECVIREQLVERLGVQLAPKKPISKLSWEEIRDWRRS